ncbi:hypothetical protein BDV32DRAFT_92274 [Aspergillus pseudonomiae]|nr:hypothetical protein BDV32DRAFT_92274 [Aspergillus pseudonomiae]
MEIPCASRGNSWGRKTQIGGSFRAFAGGPRACDTCNNNRLSANARLFSFSPSFGFSGLIWGHTK